MPHTGQIMSKYKLTWKDLTTTDFKTYLFAMFKAFIPKKKIKTLIKRKFDYIFHCASYGQPKKWQGNELDTIFLNVNLLKHKK